MPKLHAVAEVVLLFRRYMKKLLVIFSLVMLSACSTFIPPKAHDPVMFGYIVDVKVGLSKISCDDKKVWQPLFDRIETLKTYSASRQDPQADSINKLEETLGKAKLSDNRAFCESAVRISKTRTEVVIDAWKGRK
jgi:hypothetical protein